MKKILVYGYGNPGRQDDGLGVLLAQMVEQWAKKEGYEQIVTDTNYQLNIEDAYNLNKFDVVFFADASIKDIPAYKFEELHPDLQTNFTMHAVSPSFVLGLCEQMYSTIPKAYLLHIKGYQWEFMESPSNQANTNLSKAFDAIRSNIHSFLFTGVVR